MAIKDIELFHGVVLTKLIRSERPVSLKLLEFNADTSSAAYLINDEASVYIKHSKSPRERERKNYQAAWIFNFKPEHLAEVRKLSEGKGVFTALVCGDTSLENARDMQVCFLQPEELSACINLNATKTQTITVANPTRRQLRVWGTANGADNPILVDKGALERWEAPGS